MGWCAWSGKKQKDKQKREHSQEIRTPGESKVVFRVVVGVAATMLQRQIYRFILVWYFFAWFLISLLFFSIGPNLSIMRGSPESEKSVWKSSLMWQFSRAEHSSTFWQFVISWIFLPNQHCAIVLILQTGITSLGKSRSSQSPSFAARYLQKLWLWSI